MYMVVLLQPRILMAMARDGLLPSFFSDVNKKSQVPVKSTVTTGLVAALLAFFMDVSQLAGMVSLWNHKYMSHHLLGFLCGWWSLSAFSIAYPICSSILWAMCFNLAYKCLRGEFAAGWFYALLFTCSLSVILYIGVSLPFIFSSLHRSLFLLLCWLRFMHVVIDSSVSLL